MAKERMYFEGCLHATIGKLEGKHEPDEDSISI